MKMAKYLKLPNKWLEKLFVQVWRTVLSLSPEVQTTVTDLIKEQMKLVYMFHIILMLLLV